MKYPVKIEYELTLRADRTEYGLPLSGEKGVLNTNCRNFVTAVEVNSGCFATSSIIKYPLTLELIRELKEEAKEAVLAKVREHYRAKEKAILEARILATEEFELEV